MIILDATTRSLEIDLNAAVTANQLPFVASYVDINQSTFAMSAMSTNTGASNNTTAVTLVAAPGATTSRQLKYLSVKNSDTASVLLWIQLNDNTTLREIWKGTLAVGDTLVYVDSLGFNVVDSSGGIKSSLVNTMSTLTLTSTLTMSGTAANIALGSNYISNDGTDAGLSFNASNNATLSGTLTVTDAAILSGGVRVGTGTAVALVQGPVSSQVSSSGVGNGADATDDTLFTYTLPLNSLGTNTRSITAISWGGLAANGNSKTIKWWFDGVAVLTRTVTTNNAPWKATLTVTRVDSTHISVEAFCADQGGTFTVNTLANQVVSDLGANNVIVKITGASGSSAANDVVAYGMHVSGGV